MSRLIRAELLKIFTTRLWWGLLIGVAASSTAIAVLLALIAGGATEGIPPVTNPAMVRQIYAAGQDPGRIIAVSLGIIVMAGEYRHQTMTSAALVSPRRLRIVLAKLAALSVAGVGYGIAAVLSAVLAGAPIIAARGGSIRLTSDGVPRSLALSVLALVLWAVLGLGVGTLIRNQIVALVVAISVTYLVEPLLAFILNAVHWGDVAKYLPSSATSALVSPPATSGGVSVTYLPWWGGALVLLGYATVAGALGAGLTLRRDIT
jgi:ABC-2 type transport system permease protein